MVRERVLCFLAAGGMATGLLAATAFAQVPARPTGPLPGVVCEPPSRPVRHLFGHVHETLVDNLIGYPGEFVEPPAGFALYETFAVMKAKADPHKFTLYRSDFLAGSDRLNTNGASRFNIMAARLPAWAGPITVEWSPDEPGLADKRRLAVLAYLQGGGIAVIPERVVVGPSAYPGALGSDATNFFNNLTTRNQAAGAIYSLTPNAAGSLSGGSGGGGR